MKNLKRFAVLALLATLAVNAVPAHATGVQPDLAPMTIGVDGYGNLTITLFNLGTGSAEPSEVRVWEFGQVQVLSIPGIAAGGTRVLRTTLKSMPGQAVVVSADWGNQLIESNETNNTRSYLAY